jgi:hypothetical protein
MLLFDSYFKWMLTWLGDMMKANRDWLSTTDESWLEHKEYYGIK